MKRLALLALLCSSSAMAQQAAVPDLTTAENATDRAVSWCKKNNPTKCLEMTLIAEAAIDRALAILAPAPTPAPTPAPSPTPTPTPIAFPKVGDVQPIASGLNVTALLGPKSIPPSAAPDVVGAFRFLCGPGQISYDDPIVYPGQPGAAHLHQFFGHLGANAFSDYVSIRRSGETTCHNDLNRSMYWIPALLDGKGNVVRPDLAAVYYKRRPASDPWCLVAGKGCVGIPAGIKFVYGWDQTRPGEAQPENTRLFNFKCVQDGHPTTAAFPDMAEPMKLCGPGQQLSATISTPPCWNGVDLDTPNHRSHLAEMKRDASTGYVLKCPETHPWIIPVFTLGVLYSIEAGDDPTVWLFSSDHMLPPELRRPGGSFHGDYGEGWEDIIRIRWERGCLDKMLNCSDGDLGDGQIMLRGPHYPSGKASPRLVPVPTNGGG